ncbi:uncharacterized protein LOC133314798 [Gastrolobium bilobum]|uniref:uncharacterized protein LOC133314798 n=1 Tax=Gastrolobium bilobum TaxID=150636 RepID=UPI002AB0318D|nr:uncharacterized protein LOC133314798 [Gastrolobium bilobum]
MAENNQLAPRTLGDYMTPARVPQTASIVRLTIEANNFELKLALLQLIQKDQFAGGSTENPYSHLHDFLLYCDTLKVNGVSRDAILLRLFPCSLKDDARAWLQSQPERNITSWDDLARKFLARFFSASNMARLKAEITSFEQKESESLYEAWERFKGLLRKCPEHGIEAWEKARIFFQGITPNTRTLVNAAAGGSLKTKTPEEALELLESLASQEFDNAPVAQRRAKIMKLDGYDAILAQNEQMLQMHKKQQEQLEAPTKQFNHSQVSSVSNSQIKCGICAEAYATEDCDYMRTTEKLPAEANGLYNPEKAEKKLFKWEKKKALERLNKPLDLSPYARIPYPQRLNRDIEKHQYSKFLDIFRKLQINIPFVEALENIPNYARFMKDLLSRKRKLQECETVILTEECNVIIQKKLPTKVKDPGSFSIPCTIGKVEVDNVLCDLGASINVMPLSIMKKLGITEVKPTKTIVQLADRSSKQVYGIIEDILVKGI